MTDPLIDWDRDVLRAIVAAGADGASIPGILDAVDAWQKMVLTLAELNGSLGRLTAAGLIVAHSDGRFATPRQTDEAPGAFQPITADAYREAVEAYHAAFGDALRQIVTESTDPDSRHWPKLSGAWRFPDDHYATDLELEGIGAVLVRVVDALAADGFASMTGGLSVGPGSVSFAVFGGREADAERMLRVARPQFVAAAPHGSELAVDEWDPSDIGPSWADLAAEFEHGSGP